MLLFLRRHFEVASKINLPHLRPFRRTLERNGQELISNFTEHALTDGHETERNCPQYTEQSLLLCYSPFFCLSRTKCLFEGRWDWALFHLAVFPAAVAGPLVIGGEPSENHAANRVMGPKRKSSLTRMKSTQSLFFRSQKSELLIDEDFGSSKKQNFQWVLFLLNRTPSLAAECRDHAQMHRILSK